MSCVIQRNEIALQVAAEVGDIYIDDLYGYVEEFCKYFPQDNASSGFAGNYTDCAIQTTGLHFFNTKPAPSGQQYTGISVAQSVIGLIPEAEINNETNATLSKHTSLMYSIKDGSCGNPPAPLSTTMPNVLVIGDSISEPGSGYGPGLESIFMDPGQPWRPTSGPIAMVQHNGATGSNQAGPSSNGAACIKDWVAQGGWDVITMNFGIHDCCPGGDGRPAGVNIPKADYIRNLGLIYDTASRSLGPNGTIVWVSTTPHSVGHFDCNITGAAFNQCIDEYNEAALEFFSSKSNVVVSDLNKAMNSVCGYGFTTCNLQRWMNVHPTTAGKQFLAVELAHTIAPLLAPKWRKIIP